MMTSFRRLARDTSGVAAIEGAMVLPVVIGLILAAMTFGFGLTEAAVLDWAATRSESVVATGGNDAAVIATVTTKFKAAMPWTSPSLTVTRTLASDAVSTDVTISMPLPVWSFLMPSLTTTSWVGRTP